MEKPAKSMHTRDQRVTLDVSARSLIHGLELVDAGRYDSLDELVAAAIELVYRSRGGTPHLRFETPDPASLPPVQVLENANVGSPATVSALPPTTLPQPLIPITVPRFLPAKLVLRFLARSLATSGSDYLEATTARSLIRERALSWTDSLRALDAQGDRPRGERVATALPTADRDQEKSLSRFLEAYLGSRYAASPRVGGALSFLGFISFRGEAGEEQIGITTAGLEFARASNPVLDEQEATFPPFRTEEVSMLLSAIRGRSPEEYEHLVHYLRSVAGLGRASREALNQRMRNFYVRFWSPLALSRGMVESLRATVNSRCQELGFVRTLRGGRTSSYAVTDAGSRWLATEHQGSGGGTS